ncbi:hypothetical protein Nepgr_000918 [Nepenthes gracilis]|uniref:Leucine-rich repeat-containing N-terminal plant-type domain-containing protein n=1 Tax=Nepenthes gracilis TaxID=150966 RepID=A0AAD3P7A3_NEPGR|nr:hypothetical protein Nepgr_000918 [Nepenthes gracilis]
MNARKLSIPCFSLCTLLLLFLRLSAAQLCHPNDKNTLLQILDTMGNPPQLVSAWQLDINCCSSWAIDCNADGRVTYFFAFKSDRSFQIPSVVGDLEYLQNFNFISCPNLNGTIPKKLTKLKHLETISVSSTNLTGPIPNYLGKITTLKNIYLNSNNISGSIPSSLGRLPNLTELDLSGNKLTGHIPKSLGSLIKPLSKIVLAANHLTGPIPRSLGNLNLSYVDLSLNNLRGDASFLFRKNKTALWYVNLGRNSLSFNFSTVEIPSTVADLVVNNNKIYGGLPPSIAVPYFEEFNVSYNRLCGPIPAGGSLQLFDDFAFSHNLCLCGPPLPPCS